MNRILCALSLSVLLASASAAADFTEVCGALSDGAAVRVALLDGTTREGRVAGWDGDRLKLIQQDGTAASCVEGDASALWLRERRTAGGVKAGALTGGIAGSLSMAGLVILFNAMDDDGIDDRAAVTMMLGLTGTGAGIGALVGGVTGSSLPKWELLWARPDWPADGGGSAASRPLRTGGVELLLGSGTGDGDGWPGKDGLAVGLRWRSELSPRWTVALEYAHFDAREPALPGPDGGYWYTSDAACHLLGALLQANLTTGAVRPYVVGSLGGYWWREDFLGGGLGGGVEADFGPNVAGRLEYRRHGNIQRLAEADPTLTSVMAGVTLAW